jgi:hypothetical protein
MSLAGAGKPGLPHAAAKAIEYGIPTENVGAAWILACEAGEAPCPPGVSVECDSPHAAKDLIGLESLRERG